MRRKNETRREKREVTVKKVEKKPKKDKKKDIGEGEKRKSKNDERGR
jgi:hypothetical protein